MQILAPDQALAPDKGHSLSNRSEHRRATALTAREISPFFFSSFLALLLFSGITHLLKTHTKAIHTMYYRKICQTLTVRLVHCLHNCTYMMAEIGEIKNGWVDGWIQMSPAYIHHNITHYCTAWSNSLQSQHMFRRKINCVHLISLDSAGKYKYSPRLNPVMQIAIEDTPRTPGG